MGLRLAKAENGVLVCRACTSASGFALNSLDSHPGIFISCADARVYGVKQDWSVVKEFTDVPKKVCGSYSASPY